MTVKADSKGRLTGAQPETRYLKRTDPDGTITYVPEVPRNVTNCQDVTTKQFKDFFGVSPDTVAADSIRTTYLSDKGFLPHGIFFEWFATDGSGHRVYETGEAIRGRTLIRIRKEDS